MATLCVSRASKSNRALTGRTDFASEATMAETVLSLMVLTALALAGGGLWLWRKQRAGRQALLMLALAAVLSANVALWAVPNDSGETLATTTPDR